MGLSVGVAGLSALFAYDTFINKPERAEKFVQKFGALHRLVDNKYFVDEFYFSKIINPLVNISKGLWFYIDVNFIDKITYKVSEFVKSTASGIRTFQSGSFQAYALYMVLGMAVIISFVMGA